MIMNPISAENANSRSNEKIKISKNVLVVEAQIDSSVKPSNHEHVNRITKPDRDPGANNLPVFFGRGAWSVNSIKNIKRKNSGSPSFNDTTKPFLKPKTSALYPVNLDEIIEVQTDEENGEVYENDNSDGQRESTSPRKNSRTSLRGTRNHDNNGIEKRPRLCDKDQSVHMTTEYQQDEKNTRARDRDHCPLSSTSDYYDSHPKGSLRTKKGCVKPKPVREATRCSTSSSYSSRATNGNQLTQRDLYLDHINPGELLQSCDNCRQTYYSPDELNKYEKINSPNEDNNYELFDDEKHDIPALLNYRSRSLPQLSVHDSGLGSGQDNGPGKFNSSKLTDLRQLLTLRQHYYPETGWGWIIVVVGVFVHILSHGIHGAVGLFIHHAATRFSVQAYLDAGWLGAMSTGVALLISPVTIGICRRKSTRVTAVLGGLVTALGCLFTSFATQFHQLFFSYGAIVGVGVGITRDCSTLMVAQYFKRKREFVEIFIVSGSGLGIAIMSAFIKTIIGKIGWRLGLQAVTVTVFSTFFLGTFYRSASLYHPQRRAILHLKTQKRKIKEKNKVDDRPPILDFATLKSKTVRILLLSTGISAFGINTPIFYLAHQIEEEGLGDMVVLLQAYLGLGWTVGCVTFGLLVIRQNVECRIARQYLMQTAIFICGICILALTTVHGNYYGYVMFTWIYGIFCGGYHYSLKMYTYERVRARNFVRTWGFVQFSQAIPIAIGVPISGYINISFGNKAGYYFSSTCVLVGSFTLFFIDLHKRNLSKHRSGKSNGIKHTCNSNCQKKRGLSFNHEAENDNTPGATAMGFNPNAEHSPALGEAINKLSVDKPELTCISEEGIADMDLPDNILDDIEYIGDCITSCNKVENYLMLSEFENNLIAEMPIIMDRKGRKWSLARSKSIHGNPPAGPSTSQTLLDEDDIKSKWLLMPAPINNRAITVIEEASTSQVES